MKLEEKIERIAEPIINEQGLRLVDVEYLSRRGRNILRIIIDKEGGISLDDCQNLSRQLSHLLDVEDPIPAKYNLEVSSPGLFRRLKSEREYKNFIGKKVLIIAAEQQTTVTYQGKLTGYDNGIIALETSDGSTVMMNIRDVIKARLNPDI